MEKIKILVLDDKEANRNSARNLFADKNVDLVCVDCFSTAANVLDETYDIVLTDLMLPGEAYGCRENHPQVGQELPYGLIFALMAKNMGIEHVAILTDASHHSGPIAWAMTKLMGESDFIKVYNHKDWLHVALDFEDLADQLEENEKNYRQILLLAGGNDDYKSNLKKHLISDELEVIVIEEEAHGQFIQSFVEKKPDFTVIIGELNPKASNSSFFVKEELKRILGIKEENQKVLVLGFMLSESENYLRLPLAIEQLKSFLS